eukprot:44470_1
MHQLLQLTVKLSANMQVFVHAFHRRLSSLQTRTEFQYHIECLFDSFDCQCTGSTQIEKRYGISVYIITTSTNPKQIERSALSKFAVLCFARIILWIEKRGGRSVYILTTRTNPKNNDIVDALPKDLNVVLSYMIILSQNHSVYWWEIHP